MSLRYCLKCKAIRDDEKANVVDHHHYCPECGSLLRYFGAEPVHLSQAATQLDANQMALFDDIKSEVKTFSNPAIDMNILECEDALKHKPDNVAALLHLALLHKTKQDWSKAKHYFKCALDVDPRNQDVHQQLADIYLTVGDFEDAIQQLKTIAGLEPVAREDTQFNLGVAHMYIEDHHKAQLYFEKAKDLAQSERRKSEIQTILDQMSPAL